MIQVARGFVSVGDREVHYRRLGSGPPALFIHSSPTNSSFVLADMQAQADRYTCFAFDTPGFGLSDPLPWQELGVADLARATAEAIEALGLPPMPVFGTHTGAAIALELGFRYPEKVLGLVLDGVPIFTSGEVAALGDSYFAPLEPDALGGHFSATWTRFRDQYRWFPWYACHPDALNGIDLGDPLAVHRWTEMFFAAAAHYKSAYRAAIAYGQGAIVATAGLRVPAVFTATETDMLHPHLRRLPPLAQGQCIAEVGAGGARKYALVRESFARFGDSGADHASAPQMLASGDGIRRQFVEIGGRPLLFRYAGATAAPPLMLIHDLPGSGKLVADRIRELAATGHLVIAPDLPGSGESEGMEEGADLAEYAAALWALCDALGIAAAGIEGHGFGSSLALAMAAEQPGRCRALAIDGILLPDRTERADLLARYAPEIGIEADGAHWYRLWLRLRDSLVAWPWYDTGRAALRREPADFSAGRLHDWTVEVMKQWSSQHRLPRTILRFDSAAQLEDLRCPLTILPQPRSPVAVAYADRLHTKLEGAP